MEQRIVDLWDEFTHGGMDRRDFMQRLAGTVGGMSGAVALLPSLENDYARVPVVSPDHPSIRVQYVSYAGPSGDVRAYNAAPTGGSTHPAVVVIHENRGLNPHIEDIARRAAAAGFWAIAPDALSPLGGTPDDTDTARSRMRELDPNQTLGDFVAGATFAANHASTNGRVGCVGFCWGGGMANSLAVTSSDLNAAVAFYGRQPATADVPKIRAALLLHYAELDERINAGIADYEAALEAAGVEFTVHMYEGVNHAFHNDTSPTRYDEAAAKLAWSRTIEFFKTYLKA